MGALLWPQYTDWASLRDAAAFADELGYDSLWTWDHLYPIVGSPDGPIFEGYLTLAGWAAVTKRATLGLMVGANTFRYPALTAKEVTTLDHLSNGRAVLGIGGAWFETEHEALGIEFGSGFGERLPPPVQEHLPILIGGGGEKKTLRTTARFADMWNIGGDVDEVRHKDEVLRRWCDEVGRDTNDIERTLQGNAVILRDDVKEAERVGRDMGRRNGGWEGADFTGTPDQLVEHLAPYLELGFRHFYIDVPAPYDRETIERTIREVKPGLEQLAATTAAR
jgi:alkanesulfonate monooxygenase SsuD/methylene tetrahydromethanopterin reductase-like flavin-dependent oxidoreductase (luciferase family)